MGSVLAMKQRSDKLYRWVLTAIAAAIDEGRHPVGTRLPGKRGLAEAFAVSRPTVRDVMVAPELRGLVVRRLRV